MKALGVITIVGLSIVLASLAVWVVKGARKDDQELTKLHDQAAANGLIELPIDGSYRKVRLYRVEMDGHKLVVAVSLHGVAIAELKEGQ